MLDYVAVIGITFVVAYVVAREGNAKRYAKAKAELASKRSRREHGDLEIEIENRTGYAINLEIDENVVYLLDVEGEL
jgi:hypothetical protein